MPRSLHITTVMPFFYPATQYGGPVVQAYEVGKELLRRGHRVSVVASDMGQPADTPRDCWNEVEGMRVWYGTTRAINRVVPYWEPQLRRALCEAIPHSDVLQLRMGLTLLSEQVRKLAARTQTPYVYNAEGALCPRRLKTKRLSKALFLRIFERRIIRQAAAVQAVTAVEARDVVAQGADPSRVHLIPNGVRVMTAEPGKTRGGFRQRWGVPGDVPLILFLGRVARLKGLEPLVRGFATSACPTAHLVIAGPGDGEEVRLTALCKQLHVDERVHFVGTIAGSDCRQAMADADIFVLTSFTEGLPNAVLEALATGLPVLISEACNVPEVAAFNAGVVVTPEPAPIAAALQRLVSDRELREAMSRNALRLVAERFELARIVDQLEQLYFALARRN